MNAASEWVTSERRTTLEAGIQERVRQNGHPPLRAQTMDALIVHAARSAVLIRGSVGETALTIVDILWPAPPLVDTFARTLVAIRAYEKGTGTATVTRYRPEPPRSKKGRTG